MFYLWQHSETISKAYDGSVPLSIYLKDYFRTQPKLGSRDRRLLSDMAYCWYRCSKGFTNAALSFQERMQCALFLCSGNAAALARLLPADWQEQPEDVPERIAFLGAAGHTFSLDAIFPFSVPISEGIEKKTWLLSLLQQPALFLRVRKLHEHIEARLVQKELPFNWLTNDCLELPNGTSVQELFPEDAYVVQDASSQATGDYFQPEPDTTWWDCCAGAGGKALLLCDMEPGVKLTVSDKRNSILHNLRQRFNQYRLAQPKSIITDVADEKALRKVLGNLRFDAIICDAPCTGSGTWARTPEQLYFFREEMAGLRICRTHNDS